MRLRFFLGVLGVSVAGFLCLAQDWPQWRGPHRDGAIASFRGPAKWPESLAPVWKVNVGIGHSSPIVVGNRVYQHSREQEREVVTSLDLDTGKVLWRESYPAPYTMNPAARGHGEGPKSTPVAGGRKLFTLGISGILSCFDLQTGKLQWRKDFAGQFDATSPDFGTAMSPVLDNGLLIAHVGGNTKGALTAFAANSGEVKWSWTGDGPAYASPIVVDFAGTRQVVTQSRQNIVSVSAASGELLWSIPFTTPYVQNIVTPVLFNQMLIFSGLDNGTMAVRLIKQSNKWMPEKVWETKEVSMYMSSPVLSGDLLFGMSHKNRGQYFALDARSGAILWTSPARQGDNAAIVQGGGVLFILNNEGQLVGLPKSAKSFEPLKSYKVAETPTWAHPVVVGKRVLIKDLDSLALLSLE